MDVPRARAGQVEPSPAARGESASARGRVAMAVATLGLVSLSGIVGYHSGRWTEADAQRAAVEGLAASWDGPRESLDGWLEASGPDGIALLTGWVELQADLRGGADAARLASHVATLAGGRSLVSGGLLRIFERDVAFAAHRVAEHVFAEAVADLGAVPRPGLAVLRRVRDRLQATRTAGARAWPSALVASRSTSRRSHASPAA